MAQRTFVYDLIAEQPGGVRKENWPNHASLTGDDAKKGRFVERNADGYAVKANNGVFTATRVQRMGAVAPIYVGSESPDAAGNSMSSVIVGPHRALTNGYHTDPSALTPARPAWGATTRQALVSVDGKLAPFLNGTDKDYSIIGFLVKKASANAEDLIEVQML